MRRFCLIKNGRDKHIFCKLDVRGSVHHSIIHQKNTIRCNSVSKFFISYLYEAQHVSDDTRPIIRNLKLHWQPLVYHKWRVVGRVLLLLLFSTYALQPSRLIVRSGLDVPTFATRRLYACHHATAPSGRTVSEKYRIPRYI